MLDGVAGQVYRNPWQPAGAASIVSRMTSYRGRRAATIENDALRLTVLEEGGHIAEIADKATGINPLWTPEWPSIEPSRYDPAVHAVYGGGMDAPLLAG